MKSTETACITCSKFTGAKRVSSSLRIVYSECLWYANTYQHKMIHKYAWTKENERSLIDNITVDKKLRRWVQDAKVVTGILCGLDHFPVVAKE